MAQMPQFFQSNPQELVELLKRSSRGSFAGAGTQLRENLANAGLLGSGAYPMGLTQLGIAQGQQEFQAEAGFLADSYKLERGAELDFQIQNYLEEQKRKQAMLEALLGSVGALGGGVGKIIANATAAKAGGA